MTPEDIIVAIVSIAGLVYVAIYAVLRYDHRRWERKLEKILKETRRK